MIGWLFGWLDVFARIIGWGAMIVGLLWLINEQLASNRAMKDSLADETAMLRFEDFLETNHPQWYESYRDLKFERSEDGKLRHWQRVALDCGIPWVEIAKER